jgi:hypothetical protein
MNRYLWIILIVFCLFLSHRSIKVAVCIGGQISRLMPHFLLEGLITPNPYVNFGLYYNLQSYNQSGSLIVYNTDTNFTFEPTKFAYMNQSAVTSTLFQLMTTNNSHIQSIKFFELINLPEVEKLIGYELNLFEVDAMKPRKVQSTIINMYMHQQRCIHEIETYEKQQSFHYDYIISTREDVYFFRPFNLTKLFSILDEIEYRPNPSNLNETIPHRKCHILSKECANFWGFNMRLFIYERNAASLLLTNRLKYYRHLLSKNTTLINTEVFELEMANHYHLRNCPIFIDDFAVTAVRPVSGDIFCFPFWEVFKCQPTGVGRFTGKNRCERHKSQAKPPTS